MSQTYIIEVGSQPAGIVVRNPEGYMFFAASHRFNRLDGKALPQRARGRTCRAPHRHWRRDAGGVATPSSRAAAFAKLRRRVNSWPGEALAETGPGHPRLHCLKKSKTWITGSSPVRHLVFGRSVQNDTHETLSMRSTLS